MFDHVRRRSLTDIADNRQVATPGGEARVVPCHDTAGDGLQFPNCHVYDLRANFLALNIVQLRSGTESM